MLAGLLNGVLIFAFIALQFYTDQAEGGHKLLFY